MQPIGTFQPDSRRCFLYEATNGRAVGGASLWAMTAHQNNQIAAKLYFCGYVRVLLFLRAQVISNFVILISLFLIIELACCLIATR